MSDKYIKGLVEGSAISIVDRHLAYLCSKLRNEACSANHSATKFGNHYYQEVYSSVSVQFAYLLMFEIEFSSCNEGIHAARALSQSGLSVRPGDADWPGSGFLPNPHITQFTALGQFSYVQ